MKSIKKRIALVVIALNIVISAVGCRLKEESYKEDDLKKDVGVESSYEKSESLEIIPSMYDDISLNDSDLEYLERDITINNLDSINEEIKNIDVRYPYQELYTSDYKLDIPSLNFEKSGIIVNGLVDENKLYEKVLDNNELELMKDSNSNYQALDNTMLREVTLVLTKIINKEIENKEIDLDLLDDKLSNLVVVSFNSFSNGYYNQKTGILGLNINAILSYGENAFYDVLLHEGMHLVTAGSPNELKNSSYEERYGFNYIEDYHKVNPYNWQWFREASAEEFAYKNSGRDKPLVYDAGVKTIELMKLSTFNSSSDLEKTMCSSDINGVYNYFGAGSDKEYKEIDNMFYAFNINYCSNPGEEGKNFYDCLIAIDSSMREYQNFNRLSLELKGQASLTLAKIFYQNLSRKLEGKTVKLKDIFTIISIYELEQSRMLWYHSKFEDLESFLEGYTSVQDRLFEQIAECMMVDLAYVKELYCMYNKEINLSNVNIPWLSEEENNYLNYINESRVGNKKDAILKVYSDNFEQGRGISY